MKIRGEVEIAFAPQICVHGMSASCRDCPCLPIMTSPQAWIPTRPPSSRDSDMEQVRRSEIYVGIHLSPFFVGSLAVVDKNQSVCFPIYRSRIR